MKNIFTDAVLLAVFSLLGYAVAFNYEMGYASHFGFPGYLISPTPAVVAGALVALSALAITATYLWALWIKQDSWEAKSAIGPFVAAGLIFLFAWEIYAEVKYGALILVVFGLLSLAFAASLLWRHKNSDNKNLILRSPDPRVAGIVAAASAATMLLFAANMIGMRAARDQMTFFFLEKNKEYAVVRMYGEVLVAVKFDSVSQQMTGDYLVGKFGADDFKLQLQRKVLSKPRLLTVRNAN